MREIERETERQRDRETDRETDRHRERLIRKEPYQKMKYLLEVIDNMISRRSLKNVTFSSRESVAWYYIQTKQTNTD